MPQSRPAVRRAPHSRASTIMHHDPVPVQIEARAVRHVGEHPVDLHRVPVLLRGGQRLQPGGAVVRVHPAHDGRDVADVAGRRARAQLQVQPADARVLRFQLAGAGRQFQRPSGPGLARARPWRCPSPHSAAPRRSPGIRVGARSERGRGRRSPHLVFFAAACAPGRRRRGAGCAGSRCSRGVSRRECKDQQTVLDHGCRGS